MSADQFKDWLLRLLDQPWSFYGVAFLLGGIGLRLGWAGLWGDRARGRRRCPKCWYDLRGTTGLRCSECGFTARAERQLFRNRRRRGYISLALFLLAAGSGAALTPQVRRSGWSSIIPTSVLIVLSNPRLPKAISENAELLLFRNCWGGRNLSAFDWNLIARTRMVRYRTCWPADRPFEFEALTPIWAGGPIDVWRLRDGQHLKQDRHVFFIDLEPAASKPLVFECAVWSKVCLWRGQLHPAVTIVPTLDDAIRPVRGAAIDAAMARACYLVWWTEREWNEEWPRVRIRIYFDRKSDPTLSGIATGFKADFYEGGVFVESIRLYCVDPLIGTCEGEAHSVFERCFSTRLEDWRLRIQTDPELALRDWDRPEYWAGEFTILASDLGH